MNAYPLIPLFPLPVVVFPHEKLSLHIFEKRYKQMIVDVMKTDGKVFGVSLALKQKLYTVGCLVKVIEVVKEYPDERKDIISVGMRRYRFKQIEQSKEYYQAYVEFFDDDESENADVDVSLMNEVIALHLKFLELMKGKPKPIDQTNDFLSFSIAYSSGLDYQEKQMMMEIDSEADRMLYLKNYFQKHIPKIEKIEEMRTRVQSNGYFKNLGSINLDL